MSAHRAHHETPAERAADRMMLEHWEGRAIKLVPMFLAGVSAAALGDLGTGFTIILVAGIVGTLIMLAVLQLFHDRHWPRPYAYVAALALFLLAVVPIIVFGEAIGPTVGRMLR